MDACGVHDASLESAEISHRMRRWSSTTSGPCSGWRPPPDSDEQVLLRPFGALPVDRERTRQLDGAHIAFAELIHNPIGGRSARRRRPSRPWVCRAPRPAQPARPTDPRCPDGQPKGARGPATDRFSGGATGHKVIWQCDPMHGNTHEASTGYKTRHFDRIVDEVQGFFEVHRALGPTRWRPHRAHRRERHRVLGRSPGDLRR